jgi:DNA-binding response OmpR family regulator
VTTKPFKSAELVARVEAQLRRMPIRSGQGVFQFGPIRLDFRLAEVTKNDEPVPLSAKEFQLLRYLIERAGAAFRGRNSSAPFGDMMPAH